MSTAKKIKDLIYGLNEDPKKENKIIDETVEQIGDLLVKEIRKDFVKEVASQRDYYKNTRKTLERILKEMEEIEQTEK